MSARVRATHTLLRAPIISPLGRGGARARRARRRRHSRPRPLLRGPHRGHRAARGKSPAAKKKEKEKEKPDATGRGRVGTLTAARSFAFEADDDARYQKKKNQKGWKRTPLKKKKKELLRPAAAFCARAPLSRAARSSAEGPQRARDGAHPPPPFPLSPLPTPHSLWAGRSVARRRRKSAPGGAGQGGRNGQARPSSRRRAAVAHGEVRARALRTRGARACGRQGKVVGGAGAAASVVWGRRGRVGGGGE